MSDLDHERLESERDFLMKSLDDLETERAAGNVDDDSYRTLHDDYTARAAAVIRALRDGVDVRPVPPPRPARRRLVVTAGLVAFALVAGAALATALGARLPGQTASGNSGAQSKAVSSDARRRELEAAVAKNPSDVGARLLLAAELEADSDFAGALRQYDEIVRLDPTSAQAYTQSGRILYVTAARATPEQAAKLVDSAKQRLDRAIELDPDYADARFFRAIVLANEYQDFVGARNDVQRYLVLQPNGAFRPQALQLLADVENTLAGTPVQSPTTTTTKQK